MAVDCGSRLLAQCLPRHGFVAQCVVTLQNILCLYTATSPRAQLCYSDACAES